MKNAKCKIIIKNLKFLILLFNFAFLIFNFTLPCYALDLTRIKTEFLKGNYQAAITEGERIVASVSPHTYGLEELYYLLGLSYLKEGNYLRAADIFEIILKEFKDSDLQEEALLALGDSYFLSGDYPKAKEYYAQVKSEKFKPLAAERLSRCALKAGDNQAGQAYYTVQVGVFTRQANATNLTQKLTAQGYGAYIEKINSAYHVRVGKFQSLKEAKQTREQLAKEGYPTKIFP
jgi:tetratricopeptide (TPR) repeat protein